MHCNARQRLPALRRSTCNVAEAPLLRCSALPGLPVPRCSIVGAAWSCDATAKMVQRLIGAPMQRLPAAIGAAMHHSWAPRGAAVQRSPRRRSCDAAIATTPELSCSSRDIIGAAMQRSSFAQQLSVLLELRCRGRDDAGAALQQSRPRWSYDAAEELCTAVVDAAGAAMQRSRRRRSCDVAEQLCTAAAGAAGAAMQRSRPCRELLVLQCGDCGAVM